MGQRKAATENHHHPILHHQILQLCLLRAAKDLYVWKATWGFTVSATCRGLRENRYDQFAGEKFQGGVVRIVERGIDPVLYSRRSEVMVVEITEPNNMAGTWCVLSLHRIVTHVQ